MRTRAAFLIGSLAAVNVAAWLLTWRESRSHGLLIGTGLAAYLFGLRHAVDADHISAIDNATRRLIQHGKRPISVGLWFSLGHSTVVTLLCAALALSAAYVHRHLTEWSAVGSVAGTVISATFLFIVGAINLRLLWSLWLSRRNSRATQELGVDPGVGGGLIARLLRPLLRLIDHGWQMYFVGFLFGLGFDTASEVGLLVLSARSGQTGLPLATILLLPLLFAAGMCLIDTLDGILMLGAYGWAFIEPERKFMYNVGVTLLSVLVAFAIGTGELVQIVPRPAWLHGRAAAICAVLRFDNAGYWIIGLFAAAWGVSLMLHGPRRNEVNLNA